MELLCVKTRNEVCWVGMSENVKTQTCVVAFKNKVWSRAKTRNGWYVCGVLTQMIRTVSTDVVSPSTALSAGMSVAFAKYVNSNVVTPPTCAAAAKARQEEPAEFNSTFASCFPSKAYKPRGSARPSVSKRTITAWLPIISASSENPRAAHLLPSMLPRKEMALLSSLRSQVKRYPLLPVSNVPLLGTTSVSAVGTGVGDAEAKTGDGDFVGDFVGTVVGDATGTEGDVGVVGVGVGAPGGKVVGAGVVGPGGKVVGARVGGNEMAFTRWVAISLNACCINVFLLWVAYSISKFVFGTSALMAVFAKEYENCMDVPASVCSP